MSSDACFRPAVLVPGFSSVCIVYQWWKRSARLIEKARTDQQSSFWDLFQKLFPPPPPFRIKKNSLVNWNQWMRSNRVWMRSFREWMRSSWAWMRSSRVVRASDSQCHSRNCLGSIPAFTGTVESVGQQMKQCWKKELKKSKKSPWKKNFNQIKKNPLFH